MNQVYQKKQNIIYLDYTAGRGNYDDDDYQESKNFNEIKKEKTSIDIPVKTENHCVFSNFSDIKPHYLNQQKLNQIQHQRC